jgi:hypothetical protein
MAYSIVKELTGEVSINSTTSGNTIKQMAVDACLFFSNRRQAGGVYVVDSLGGEFWLDASFVDSTQILPAAAVDFSGDARDLYELLEASFFYNVVSPSNGSGNVVEIAELSDFPTPDINDEIHLLANTAYYIKNHIDLNNSQLVCDGICAIFGSSSETSSLTSKSVNAMITSAFTLPIQNISLTSPIALDLDATANPDQALDWDAVNFVNCPIVGTIKNYGNFILTKSSFLNSSNLTFDGTVGTIGVDGCLFNAATGGTAFILPATLTITRRFRLLYSAFVILAGETGIDFNAGVTVPDEAYILQNISFAGGGTYLSGINSTSNKALFNDCTGIVNTSVNGQIYMNNNATVTPIAVVSTFYKAEGVTTASPDNSKYTATDNRLTNDSAIARKYAIFCNLSFTSGNNNVCEFGFYDSKLGGVRLPSRTKGTANAAGRAENIGFMCVVQHAQGDYLEIWCANDTGSTDITVTDMNFVITEIR